MRTTEPMSQFEQALAHRAVRRAAVAARILAAVSVLALLGGCFESLATPDVEPEPEVEEASVRIAGPCAEPRTLGAPTPAAEDEWAPVTVSVAPECFRMTASRGDASGVALDAVFVLESAVDLTPEALEELLAVEPPIAVEVAREPSGAVERPRGSARSLFQLEHRYVVEPVEALAPGQALSIRLTNAPGGDELGRWAFQATGPVAVVQTLPADGTSSVPIDTGIEITFNRDGVTGVEEAFTVEPPVDGSFETHGRTVVFVPESLAERTLYTVRIGEGPAIEGTTAELSEPFSFQFETGSQERTGEAPPVGPAFRFTAALSEQPTGEPPVLSLYATGETTADSIETDVRVLRFESLASFMDSLDAYAAVPSWAYETRSRYAAETEGMAQAATFAAPLRAYGSYGEYALAFPEALPEGAYLVEADVTGGTIQAWLQITDVAPYVAVSDDRLLVWVHDVATGEPVEDAEVSDGSETWVTDAEGIAFVDTPDAMVQVERDPGGWSSRQAEGTLTVAAPEGGTVVVPLSEGFRSVRRSSYRDPYGGGVADAYWRYLYADRQLYRLTDEIRFWGIARTRDGGGSVGEVTVDLRGGTFTGTDYQEPILAQATVGVGPTGTYSGSLRVEGVSPGFYSLRAAVGDDELNRIGVELRDFVKPAYELEVRSDVRAVLAGEIVTSTVLARFFEGSPVPNVALQVDGDATMQVTTDENGAADVSYRAPVSDAPYLYWTSNIYVRPVLPEEGQIAGGRSVLVVPADVLFEATGELAGDTGVISGTVRAADLERYNQSQAVEAVNVLGDPIAGRPVTAEVVQLVQVPVVVGQSYDYVSKQTVDDVRYDTEEVPIGTLSAVSAEDGSFEILFPAEEDGTYRAIVSLFDDKGRQARQEFYIGPSFAYGPAQPWLFVETEGPYAVGESVEMSLRVGNSVLPEGDGYLFLRAQNGIQDYTVQQSPRYGFTFEEAHVPNTHVLAARFDGRTYQEVPWSASVAVDADTKALAVDVRSDRERYEPGDDVEIDVTTTGPDGEPREASVLLAAVDAAIVEMQGGSLADAFRDTLYASVGSGVVRTYASHQKPLGSPGAEGGGGGDGRGDFRDVALFEEVQTDADGTARLTLSVPDNLTSWVVTGQGVTDDLLAGTGLLNVPVGVPLFADVTLADSYLEADEPVVRLRAYGEGLSDGDAVLFEVESDTLLDEPVEIEAEAFVPVDVPLGPLSAGDHELRVAVSSGEMVDALVRGVSVVPSRLASAETTSTEVPSGTAYAFEDPEPDRPVDLVVTDAARGRYFDDLSRLSWTHGDRLDQLVGRNTAIALMSEYFTTTQAASSPVRPEVYQREDGGAALLPYGDSDLGLSAQIASTAPTTLGRQGLVAYFTGVLDDAATTGEMAVEALYGLASLGEPVLARVQSLASDPDVPVRSALQLGLAAMALGDSDTAGTVYGRTLEEYGEQRGATARVAVSDDRDEILEATVLAARLGAGLADPLAPGLYEYVATESPDDLVLVLDEVGYLQAALPRTPSESLSVSYNQFGEHQERDLAPGESLALRVTPDEAADLGLHVTSGIATVAASTLVPLDPEVVESDPALALSRTHSVYEITEGGDEGEATTGDVTGAEEAEAAGAASVSFDEGDLVRVRLEYALDETAAAGCHQLTDLLASGLRAATAPYDPSQYYEGVDDASLVFPYQVEGPRVSFCVFRDGEQDPISYLARVVTKGRYVAEPALLQSLEAPSSRTMTPPVEVSIR